MSTPNLVQFPGGVKPPGSGDDLNRAKTANVNLSYMKEYWILFKRYKWIILAFALVGAVVGYLNAATAIPIYEARLVMLIQPPTPSNRIEDSLSRRTNPYFFFQTQYGILKSRAVAERVVASLDPSRYLWIGEKTEKTYLQAVAELFERGGEIASESGYKKILTLDEKRELLLGLINGNIQVEEPKRSQLVGILFESHDPQFATDVVNTAAEAYMALSLDARLEQAKIASGWLTEQIEGLREKVAVAEENLQAFQSSENLVDTTKNRDLVRSRLNTLTESYTQAQNKVSQLEERYGEKHPTLIAAIAEMKQLKNRLDREKEQAVGAQIKEFQLAKLERDASTFRQLYDQFVTRVKETDVATQYDINDVRVIDQAQVPVVPVRPNKQKIMLGYCLAGLALGIFLVWLRDQLDNTFKDPGSIEQRTGFPVIGVVPYISKTKSSNPPERFYISNTKSGFGESINHIRTSVLYTNVDHPPKVIMVTSALQAEGKTTLSSNLALAFSQLGRTLLIDADMRKPRVAEILGVNRGGGLADVIAGQTDISSSIARDSESKNLYIMKSGTQPPNPLELLSSEKFSWLTRELRGKFDHIVIDSAPVLPVSDAIVLGNVVDTSIVMIRAEKTNRSAAINALDRLSKANVPIVGVVLSQVTTKNIAYYYSDNYYGYYGEYYGSPETATRG